MRCTRTLPTVTRSLGLLLLPPLVLLSFSLFRLPPLAGTLGSFPLVTFCSTVRYATVTANPLAALKRTTNAAAATGAGAAARAGARLWSQPLILALGGALVFGA